MNPQPTITLSIKESGAPPNTTYLFHISLDGHPLLTNQSLSFPDSEKLRQLSRSYSSLFEQACRPEMDAGAEAALGAQLFGFFLASSWEKIRAALPSGRTRFLTIASDNPEILNLPWEMLLPPEGDFLGLDPLFAIRRLPGSVKKLESFTGSCGPGPCACSSWPALPPIRPLWTTSGKKRRSSGPSSDKKQQAVIHFNSRSLLQIRCLLTLKAILLDSLRFDPDNVSLPCRKIDLDNALETKQLIALLLRADSCKNSLNLLD